MIYLGSCLDILPTLPANSVDAIVTDPPYHLTSIVKRFGSATAAPAGFGTDGAFARASRGFMGQQWDGGDIAFRAETWAHCLRVLKPGGHLAAFSGTRTYHRMAVAIEDAGFEIRDQLAWAYGSGFPKSHDVSKAIDARLLTGGSSPGNLRRRAMGEAYRPHRLSGTNGFGDGRGGGFGADEDRNRDKDIKVRTPEAAQWEGWGTALKPAWEPIALARKPLDGTVARNVLAHGVGALNIDGCRVHGADAIGREYTVRRLKPGATLNATGGNWRPEGDDAEMFTGATKDGRWPANILHDGEAFSDATWSRYFYCAKASKADRGEGNDHPTVKPHDLMRWLCRLVTPPGGLVLDPFTGSGSTGRAALAEGFRFTGIELSADYAAIAARRSGLPLTTGDLFS
jgi:DNA modification methylase